jgi:hypothetical protein
MRPIRLLVVFALILTLAAPAWAWNFSGHWIAAAIAYQRLTPAVRARVDDLIRQHPDYEKMNFPDAPSDPESRARAAFIHAASWPDEIRNDPRFYDDTRADPTPTPLLPGFPGMQRHTNWHYADMPFSPDNTPLIPTPTPNAVTEIRRMLAEISPTADPAMVAYDLPWLVHLVADIHNPLHATSRFTKDLPQGDQGGNLVFVYGKTLHAYWDDAASPREIGYEGVLKYARDFMARQAPPVTSSLNPRTWLQESFKVAKSDVYTFGDENGTKEKPVKLPPGYPENAQKVARQRLTLSGYLLGSVLNARLR